MAGSTEGPSSAGFPEAWKPQPGEELVGKVTDITVRDSGYGDYPLVEVERGDGSVAAWHAFHSVARSELAKRGPQVGDVIVARYDGKRENAKGESYHSYAVKLGGPPKPTDWSKFGGDPPPVDKPPDRSPATDVPVDDDGPLPF